MIEEIYVSFETAKLLNEKGFNEGCINTYNIHNGFMSYSNYNKTSSDIWCPTQQVAMKWLRDINNLFIQIFILTDNGYWFNIEKLLDNYNHKDLYSTGLLDIYYPTYEEACEAAIQYSLENLIV